MLHTQRFCDGCYADAAKDCAHQIEASLIRHSGFDPAGTDIRRLLPYEATFLPLAWFESASMLGQLSVLEAIWLRNLTEMACRLVAAGGVAALAELPGTHCLEITLSNPFAAEPGPDALPANSRPQPQKGRCDFRALPQWDQTEPDARPMAVPLIEQQQRYNAYCAAVMIVILMMLVVRW